MPDERDHPLAEHTLRYFEIDRPLLSSGGFRRISLLGGIASIVGLVGGVLVAVLEGKLLPLAVAAPSLLLGFSIILLWIMHVRQTRCYQKLSGITAVSIRSMLISHSADPELAYLVAREAIGVTKDQLHKSILMTDGGGATMRQSMTVAAVNQAVQRLEHRISLYTNDDPNAGDKIIVPKTLHSPGRSVTVERLRLILGRVGIYQLFFEPKIDQGTKASIEPFEVTLPNGTYAMSLAALKEAEEYTSVASQYPMDSVRLEVLFPEHFVPRKIDFDVWCGDAKLPHAREKQRILSHGYLTDGRGPDGLWHAVLQVPFPLVGLRYAITWIPPEEWPPTAKEN